MDSVRIDKWLWAARFFKTRALAAKACDLGRIQANGNDAKPARDVRPGDRLHIRTERGDFEVEVKALSQMRGPAAVAQALYEESEASREARAQLAAQRKAMAEVGAVDTGRPTKRDRRLINRMRGRN
jgi:ribosome-associated heat shock protein Hsp15